jgi:hypothetical protein
MELVPGASDIPATSQFRTILRAIVLRRKSPPRRCEPEISNFKFQMKNSKSNLHLFFICNLKFEISGRAANPCAAPHPEFDAN